MGEAANDEQGAQVSQENAGKKRQRSQLAFPYTDLERAIELAEKLAELGGPSQVEITQLAAALNQTADGGTFRGRMSAARLFGLVETSGDMAQLTPLGQEVLDPARSASAKVAAFLRVPLYEKLYSEYQGYPLPQAAAIQRKMVMLGLPQKQVERARQVFASSVDTAGFINANGRFVKPVVAARADPMEEGAKEQRTDDKDDADQNRRGSGGNDNGGGGGGDGKDHPLIAGLLVTLPTPGDVWNKDGRQAWLKMAESIFDMIYKKPSGDARQSDNFDSLE